MTTCKPQLSEAFSVAVGGKQGCMLVLTLINIFLAAMMRNVYFNLDGQEQGVAILHRH